MANLDCLISKPAGLIHWVFEARMGFYDLREDFHPNGLPMHTPVHRNAGSPHEKTFPKHLLLVGNRVIECLQFLRVKTS